MSLQDGIIFSFSTFITCYPICFVQVSRIINANSKNYSVDDENFKPDTEYAARVRSSPSQAHYMGQWSDWSSEVQWKTGSAVTSKSGEKVTTAH